MTGRVHVIGSANVDRTVRVDAMPGKGETVLGGDAFRGPGGKGLNQAVAAARMGVATVFVGAFGRDPDGDFLAGALTSHGVDIGATTRVDQPSGLAVILLEPDGSNRIVVSPGANLSVDPAGLSPRSGDVVIAQLEIPRHVVMEAMRSAREAGSVTVLNAAPAWDDLGEILPLVDVLVVNEPELAAIARSSIGVRGGAVGDGGHDDDVPLVRVARSVRRALVVTRGADGALLVEHHDDGSVSEQIVPAPAVDVVDTTGAGDCFVGVLAAALARGVALSEAVESAVAAASLSVGKAGASTSMPTRADLPPQPAT